MPERLLDIPEAQQYLHVSRVKVYELIKTGQLASLKIGKSRRVPESAVDAFIQARLAEASDDAA